MELSINGAKILYTFENVPLFGKVDITQTLVVSWLVVGIICALCIWLGSGLTVTNISRKQAVGKGKGPSPRFFGCTCQPQCRAAREHLADCRFHKRKRSAVVVLYAHLGDMKS